MSVLYFNKVFFIFIISVLLYTVESHKTTKTNESEEWTFPPGFLIGAATSAYQIEGAWNISGKGENVWDRYTRTQPTRVLNSDNGNVACDSYHKYKEDVKLLKKIGVDHYRFSISWSRILPTGYSNVINKDGIRYYNDLLDELERNNIKPFVTLYHWDNPEPIEELGGWLNEEIVDLFGDYARVVFREFGHRIKIFITINQANIICKNAYFTGYLAPGLKLGNHGEYLCTHNILKAHARAYHIYNDEFRAQQNGQIGIVLKCDKYYSKYKDDFLSSELAYEFDCGRYAHPIYSINGDYPEIIKRRIARNSKYENFTRTKLPKFSQEWINYIRGSYDYFGLNHYSGILVEPAPRLNNQVYINDDGLIYSYDPKWPATQADNKKVVPQAFTDILLLIKEKYGNPPVYIMENGVATVDTLEDDQRIEYLRLYLNAMLVAINKYKCNVKAYTIWSLLDNFEWVAGYSSKFGLVHVNFNDPNRTRIMKKSAHWLSNLLRTRKL